MKVSIQIAVIFIVSILFLTSLVSLYFSLGMQENTPLTVVAAANIFAVIFLVFLITRGIMHPLRDMKRVIAKVGKGDFSSRVQKTETREMEEVRVAFNDMIKRIDVIERMKTEFVSLAAHQLRTPTTAVKWAVQTLLDKSADPLSAEQKKLLDKTYSSNERMIRLVNDLLNVARIEEGRFLYKPSLKQIEDIISPMLKLYQEEMGRRGLTLTFKKEQGLPPVFVDEEKIRLALQNLLDNAMRYTKKGGKVEVRVSKENGKVQIAVQDTGIGIPEKEQAKMFEKFFRAANAKKKDTQGSGLGLYLVKNIMAAHKGGVSFQSEEEKGTTFFLTLPAKKR